MVLEDARQRGCFEAVEAAFFTTILLQFDRIYFFTLNYECCPVSNQEVRQFSLSEAAALGFFEGARQRGCFEAVEAASFHCHSSSVVTPA